MRIGVFLDRRAHDVGDAAVVAEVNDFRAMRLQQPADHVDGGVVAVEQRCRAHEAQRSCRGSDKFGRIRSDRLHGARLRSATGSGGRRFIPIGIQSYTRQYREGAPATRQ